MGIFLADTAQTVNAAEKQVNELLERAGFVHTARCEWKRRSTWKVDAVDLAPKWGDTQLTPSFYVFVEAAAIPMAFANVDSLVRTGESPQPIEVPRFRPATRRFLRRVSREVETSLPWFQNFATPALCKQNLPNFVKPEAPAFAKIVMFLDSLDARER